MVGRQSVVCSCTAPLLAVLMYLKQYEKKVELKRRHSNDTLD